MGWVTSRLAYWATIKGRISIRSPIIAGNSFNRFANSWSQCWRRKSCIASSGKVRRWNTSRNKCSFSWTTSIPACDCWKQAICEILNQKREEWRSVSSQEAEVSPSEHRHHPWTDTPTLSFLAPTELRFTQQDHSHLHTLGSQPERAKHRDTAHPALASPVVLSFFMWTNNTAYTHESNLPQSIQYS